MITYPGMCGCPQSKGKGQPPPPCPGGDAAHQACRSGAAYSQAIPSNRSDPLLKNWSKPLTNPIVNNTGARFCLPALVVEQSLDKREQLT